MIVYILHFTFIVYIVYAIKRRNTSGVPVIRHDGQREFYSQSCTLIIYNNVYII
jgi:hypothetical protein